MRLRTGLIDLRIGSTKQRLKRGGAVMVAYPLFAAVAVANLFDSHIHTLSAILFWAVLVYPILYAACWTTVTILRWRRKRVAALHISGLPLQYLGGLGILAAMALLMSGPAE